MVGKDDIERFLTRLATDGATYAELEDGLWLVHPSGQRDADVVVNYAPPVVLLRLKVMDLPNGKTDHGELYRRLLELNASELLHGAYGIEGNDIVLTEAMELSHLDYEEFLASYESMTLALVSHLRELAPFREGK